MGITNFLVHLLKSAGRLVDLRDYSDKEPPLRVAVDVSTWIYKVCQTYSDMLADEKHLSNYGRAALLFEQQQVAKTNEGTEQEGVSKGEKELLEFVAKCCTTVIERLEALQKATNAELLVVLDGMTPPIKSPTVEGRRKKRAVEQEHRDLPVDATADTPTLERRILANRRTGAGNHYSTVVEAVIVSLRSHTIPFLVAPYEADGQLAFLQMQGYVDLVITEDSDLIAYGVATPVLYKLSVDPEGVLTRGILVRKDDLAAMVPGSDSKLDFLDFSPAMWACLFAASGCDYCGKLRGIGVAGACRDVQAAFFPKVLDDRSPLERLLKLLLQSTWDSGKLTDGEKDDFKRDFLAAILMFRHAVIYDPVKACCRSMLLPDEADVELMSYEPYAALVWDEARRAEILGTGFPSPIATHVAEGWIRPKSMQPRTNAVIPEHVQKDLDQYMAENPRDEVINDEDAMETQEEVFSPNGITVREARSVLESQQAPCLKAVSTPDRSTGSRSRDEDSPDDGAPAKRAATDPSNAIELLDDTSDEDGELQTQGQEYTTPSR
jgi:5'-3' exonuclease